MKNNALGYTKIIETDMIELVDEFDSYTRFPVLKNVDTPKNKEKAAYILNKCAGYMSYFREMSMLVRIQKREARVSGSQDEIQHLLNLEDILDTYCKVFEQRYEYVSKLMTLKRLDLDEAKIMGGQI